MASGRFATFLASRVSRFPAPACGGRRLRSTAFSGRLRRRGSARGRSEAQVTERVWFRRRRRRARGVPSRHVPDTIRARLTIQVNRPLLHTNTRHAQRLRSCTRYGITAALLCLRQNHSAFIAYASCPAGKPYNRSRLRFYIRPNRGWSPRRHPPKFFLLKETGSQHFPLD